MRVTVTDDSGVLIEDQEMTADAVIIGSTQITDDGYESRCFIAGPGHAVLRALNATVQGIAEKPELLRMYIFAKASGDLDNTKRKKDGDQNEPTTE